MNTLANKPPPCPTRLDTLVQCLKGRGYRITPQRVAVLKIMLSSEEHPSAEEIHARVQVDYPMTSLATVYKTLALLKEMGEVTEISLGHGGSRFDGHQTQPHAHLICLKCQKIQDVDIATLETLSRNVQESTGYIIVNQRFDFFGICLECQNTPPDGETKNTPIT